ncbi:MAG: Hint domain-containing protein [Gemmobacter sp.]
MTMNYHFNLFKGFKKHTGKDHKPHKPCKPEEPERDGKIFGTRGDDLIDRNYTGDPDGDMIDNKDAILPGHAPNDDVVYAGAGNDTVHAGKGDDLVFGGAGDDLLYGESGSDTLWGEGGNDTLHGGKGDDMLLGGEGDDHLHGGPGNDYLDGGEGDDHIEGGTGKDTLVGGSGNDTLVGGPGANLIYGGGGRDLIIGANPGDYIDGGEGGDDWDTLDLRGSGPLRVTYDDSNPENGIVTFFDGKGNEAGTARFTNIEHVIPCFTPGTRIATPKGERLIEDLREGDKVITRDNGIQEIRWIGRRDLDWQTLATNQHLKPVLIRQGSLGNGLPERDTLVSPNHRVLVASDRTALYFDDREVLVAAKHLVGTAGVMPVESAGTAYMHLLFDRHEVVLSNGSWTESFQPGDYTLKGMGNAQRTEIFELFPELRTLAGRNDYGAARKTLKRHEAMLLTK